MSASRIDCDIFCKVIDNFGDIGVAWRLARQLYDEHQQQVRLWVDDLAVFRILMPSAVDVEVQLCAGVWVHHWQAQSTFEQVLPAKMVIEAFACHLPDVYRMALKRYPSLWLNLEYFSAEDWVIGCHRLPSLQHDGLKKYFFMPSIRQAAGGLLREAGLIAARDAFCCDRQQQAVWCEQYQITDDIDEAGIKISLFSYENPTMPHLIDALIHAPCPVRLYVPESKSLISLNQHLGLALRQGHHHQQGQLGIQVLPFLPQTDYDRLLWWCDLNLVRGEDSLVRAIWAGKPFIWQIYPTDDLAHQDKLQAFVQHYYSDAEADAPIISAMLAWNQMQEVDWPCLVQQLVTDYPQWQQMARLASEQQVDRSSLSQELMVWLNNIFDSNER